MDWEYLEDRAKAIIETLEQLDELGVRGPVGMSLKPAIKNVEDILEIIKDRIGSPEHWDDELDSYADIAYRLAEAYMEEGVLKTKMQEWKSSCVTSCVFDPKEENLTCDIDIFSNGLEKIDQFKVPCTREEFDESPEECNIRAIKETKNRGCLFLAKRAFRGNDLVMDPRTGKMANLTEEARNLLKNLKEKLRLKD